MSSVLAPVAFTAARCPARSRRRRRYLRGEDVLGDVAPEPTGQRRACTSRADSNGDIALAGDRRGE